MASAAIDTKTSPASVRIRFVATIFAGSFLLFLVQPMIARMALPRLGGAPAVWNSAMLVYQALLLAGYAYAHLLGRFAGRRQAAIHLALFALAALMLPIGLADTAPPVDASPFTWVPWLLLTSIGPLFMVVSAQAPLMQRWFTLSGGSDPYPLYAASNLGSFGGLIAYPLLVEPMLSVGQQSLVWSAGYVALAGLVGVCALMMPKGGAQIHAQARTAGPSWSRLAQWVAISAIPSGLMLSTTLHLTTDIVAMPLLWVVPLGLYLLSFSVAFAEGRSAADFITRIAPLLLLIAACGVFVDVTFWPVVFALAALASLFAVSVALHSRLFDSRPDPEHLTSFYLAMSVGGVVGGLFCALIAPLVFDWTYEHPILMIAAALVLTPQPIFERIGRFWSESPHAARVTRFAVVIVFLISLIGQGTFGLPDSKTIAGGATIVLLLIAVAAIGNRWLFAVALACAMLSIGGWTKFGYSLAEGKMTRSFFGVYSIRDSGTGTRVLVHGTTIHGIQNQGSKESARRPISYYAPPSGVGAALQAAPAMFGANARIGIVGLGSGTLACYAQPEQVWTFYEIDPVMVEIARDRNRFTFLSNCLPGVQVDVGDARLVLAGKPKSSADILVVDAFSSDAVPMHLLTREAFETYRSHIAPNGLLLVHISNRYLNLVPVVGAAARNGWTARIRVYVPDRAGFRMNHSGSVWVALSPDPQTIARLEKANPAISWEKLPNKRVVGWTDDFASILPIIKWTKD